MRNALARVSDPHKFVTNPGSNIAPVWSSVVDNDGSIRVVQSGKYDIQEKIESFRDTTDISYIVSRLLAGDPSVTRDTYYGDFEKMPQTYAEMLQLKIDAEKHFYDLPIEIRAKFDHDVNKYIASAGEDIWFEKMGFKRIEDEDNVKEEKVDEP